MPRMFWEDGLMWYMCLYLSIGFAVAVPVVFIILRTQGVQWARNGKITNWMLAFVFLAAFFLFLPVHFAKVKQETSGFGVLLVSAFNAIQMFAAGCDFTVVTEGLQACPAQLGSFYGTWAAVLYVMAPMVSVGFVLSMFQNISAYMRYSAMLLRDVYVFTELNARSLALATDLRGKHPRAGIVFTDVFAANEEKNYELRERAELLQAACFKKDVLGVDFRAVSKKRDVYFFAIGHDETENLDQALRLIQAYRTRENTHLYLFSQKTESELVLAKLDKGSMKVRRVNEVQSLINRILYEQGHILFNSARPCPEGDRQIGAVIVGMGQHGTEMVKALSWFGQMDGYRLRIDAFDRNERAESMFAACAPELMMPSKNGVHVPGDADCHIRIHSGIHTETEQFVSEIRKLSDTSYVFIALGDDDVNIHTAVALRMHFARMGLQPVIQVVVSNAHPRDALQGSTNYRGQAYNIDFIGDLQSSYTEAVILDSELEEAALALHKRWGDEQSFWDYEYNYRSSVASAIHLRARILCGIPGADKAESELSKTERDTIESLEHRRWNAYMRSQGYIYHAQRDDLAKMHHNIVPVAQLSEEDKRKDSRVGTAGQGGK